MNFLKLLQKIKFLSKSASDWGPALQKHKKIFFQNIETTIPLNPAPMEKKSGDDTTTERSRESDYS